MSTMTSEAAAAAAAEPTAVAPLSPSQLSLIKATVPVLQAHGTAITQTMYDNLLAAHPDLHNVFSHTSQRTGAQPRALARAVLAYAQHIDDLPKLHHAIERIAHKHASLYIQPAQYDLVGVYLIGAIKQVLGAETATPDIVDAWTAAYGVLAHVFIAREQQLYRHQGADDDGGSTWTAWRPFRIAKRVYEAEDVISFYLTPADSKTPLPVFLPGQYVSLQIPVPALGHKQSRQYSLSSYWSSSSSTSTSTYRISVKKLGGGLVSTLLHDGYREGDTVELSHPQGEFVLKDDDDEQPAQEDLVHHVSKTGSPVVLVSAGIGATPVLAMLHALTTPSAVSSRNRRRPVSWIHTSRSRATQPFGDEVEEAVAAAAAGDTCCCYMHLRQGDGEQNPRLDILALDRERQLFVHDQRTQYYVCGPEPFMVEVRRKLVGLGVDRDRVFLELFATGDVEED